MNAINQIDESACLEFQQMRDMLLKEFPLLKRFSVESHPTDSGKGATWSVMLSLKSGHCCRVVKPSLDKAIRHCIAKMQATIHEVPKGEQS